VYITSKGVLRVTFGVKKSFTVFPRASLLLRYVIATFAPYDDEILYKQHISRINVTQQ
jgi:hypothetical protein